MDSPLYAMLFAEDLIEYILIKFGYDCNRTEGVGPLRENIPKNRFRTEIGEAVYSIIEQNESTCYEYFATLLQEGLTSLDEYRHECSVAAVQTFKDGFQPETYLNICAALAAHAYFSAAVLKERARDIASVSAQVLAFIINLYIYKGEFNPSTDWFLLAVSAQKVRRRINRQRKMETEPDSGKC